MLDLMNYIYKNKQGSYVELSFDDTLDLYNKKFGKQLDRSLLSFLLDVPTDSEIVESVSSLEDAYKVVNKLLDKIEEKLTQISFDLDKFIRIGKDVYYRVVPITEDEYIKLFNYLLKNNINDYEINRGVIYHVSGLFSLEKGQYRKGDALHNISYLVMKLYPKNDKNIYHIVDKYRSDVEKLYLEACKGE